MKKLIFLSIFVLISSFVNAQITTANISGVVYDNNNQLLPGANVKAVHQPTGTSYGGVTNFDGRFDLINLRVGGPYQITVSYVGFQKQIINDVNLQLGQTFNINAILVEDDNQLEEVVITSSKNSTFSSERTGAETSIGRRELKALPTITRSAADFYRLEPTASSNGSFGGRNDQFNNFSLDGSIFNNPFGLDAATPGGQTNAQPISLDAIDQIQVSTAPYDVTQAGFTGASVNAVTKSGTNEWKGTAYAFYRNQDMTGDKVGDDDIIVPDLTQAQYGISVGGPIIKNKLFIFGNLERDDREDLGSNFLASRPGLSGANVSRVTAEDLDFVSQQLRNLGYDPGPYEGYTHDTESLKGLLKLDWNINDNHRLALIYNFLDASRDLPANPEAGGRRGPDFTTLQFRNSGYTINNKINSFLIELNSNFSGNISNKFQAGYTFFDDSRDPFSTPAPAISIRQDGVRSIIAGHEPFSINNRLEQKVYQVTNNLNIVTGNHTITIGGSFERFEFDNSFNLGTYTFTNTDNQSVGFFAGDFDSVRTTATSVNSFEEAINNGLIRDALARAQETFDTNNATGNWALAETNVGQLAFYAQDKWRMTDKLTITYGLRIDQPLFFDTKDKIAENIERAAGGTFPEDPEATYQPDITYFNENGSPVQLNSLDLPTRKLLVSPRLGFNYDVKGDKTFQIRGGTGIFTGRLPFVWIGNQVANPTFFFYTTTAPDFQFPQVWRNSLGIDYKFENGIVASTDLIYTEDINAQIVRNYGLNTPSGTLNGADNRSVYLSTDRSTPNRFGFSNDAFVFTNTNIGYSFNWSFKLQKSFKNGLFTSIAYNFLEAKDASSLDAEISSDAFNRNPALGNVNQAVETISRYGDKHRVVGQINKAFNYGKNKQWRTSIGAFYEYAKGGRFSYTYAGDINNDGSNLNDLIYIPTESELASYNFVGNTPETREAQRAAFEAYIQQDDYLRDRRGSYAEKYAILSPWRGRWDIKILQDYDFQVGERTNTIQLSLDILNFGNFLNSDWGVIEIPVNDQPIGVGFADSAPLDPIYSFDTSQTRTFTNDFSLNSRWQAQVGLRYIF